ncbi:MAG: hypothetical protein M0P39_06795 [Rhodocyclaceae bacterium]|jgi:hypothetical protein|nr:hypothetical protein [Rhodocyclaceae bacterium]
MPAVVVGSEGQPVEIPDWLIRAWEMHQSATVSIFVIAGEDQSGCTHYLPSDVESGFDPDYVLDQTAWDMIKWLTLFFIEREWIQGSNGKSMRVRSVE